MVSFFCLGLLHHLSNRLYFYVGKTLVLIATSAASTGLDAPKVRLVIDIGVFNNSHIKWHQKGGRAGRDGQYAEVWLYAEEQELLPNDLYQSLVEEPLRQMLADSSKCIVESSTGYLDPTSTKCMFRDQSELCSRCAVRQPTSAALTVRASPSSSANIPSFSSNNLPSFSSSIQSTSALPLCPLVLPPDHYARGVKRQENSNGQTLSFATSVFNQLQLQSSCQEKCTACRIAILLDRGAGSGPVNRSNLSHAPHRLQALFNPNYGGRQLSRSCRVYAMDLEEGYNSIRSSKEVIDYELLLKSRPETGDEGRMHSCYQCCLPSFICNRSTNGTCAIPHFGPTVFAIVISLTPDGLQRCDDWLFDGTSLLGKKLKDASAWFKTGTHSLFSPEVGGDKTLQNVQVILLNILERALKVTDVEKGRILVRDGWKASGGGNERAKRQRIG